MNLQLARQTKVLIVDDQVLAKGYLKYSLEELGFQHVDYVDRTNQAMVSIRERTYDLIICSYDLKHEQEGFFFYEQLKENDLLPLSTAFVFISADTSADIVHSIVELQPDEFIAKPFNVAELNKRLTRVLQRKQVLKPILLLIENEQYELALNETERFLQEPGNAEFYPLALKTKGDLLLATDHVEQAKEFYQAILNVQHFTWAQIGLVRCHLRLDEDDEAEKLILALAFRQDSMLAAYDLLTALQIKLNEFDDALESVTMASEISPRILRRHRTALDLSRINHNYQSQFDAAKRLVRYAKNSVHDEPENYLNAARAGVDFAMTADEEETSALIKQANDYLRQLKSAFPKAKVDEELTVIDARILYLQNEVDNAKALLSQLSNDNWETQTTESLLDKAKALHEVGLQDHALKLLDLIEQRCIDDPSQSLLFMQYIQQEKSEKAEITLSPRELNNVAVKQYRQGELFGALKTFRQAFTLMPRNPAIALNLLQATLQDLARSPSSRNNASDTLIRKCMTTIEDCPLSHEQEKRYHTLKTLLRDII